LQPSNTEKETFFRTNRKKKKVENTENRNVKKAISLQKTAIKCFKKYIKIKREKATIEIEK
jgi:hypothetical protein